MIAAANTAHKPVAGTAATNDLLSVGDVVPLRNAVIRLSGTRRSVQDARKEDAS
jgi:hypothetical protein